MYGWDLITAYLLVIGLLTLFAAILIWTRQRNRGTVSVWLASGVVGILLGSIGTFAIVRMSGRTIAKAYAPPKGDAGAGAATVGMPSMGPAMGAGAGGMGGMGPGMGGMGGMGGGPQPKRDLTTLVRKLDLLTGDIAIVLTPDQSAAIQESLTDIDKAEDLTDEDAKAKHEKILAALDENQKTRLDAIGLPRPPRPSGAAGPGAGPGPGGPGAAGGPGGPGGAAPQPKPNPFQQEAEGKALQSLLGKLNSPPAAAKDTAPATEPAPAKEPAPVTEPPPAKEPAAAKEPAPAKDSAPATEPAPAKEPAESK